MRLAGQADAPDVAALAGGVVEPAEDQAVLHGAQLRQTVLVHGGERIAFGALGGGAVRTGGPDGVEPCASLRAQGVEATVGAVDGVLLLLQLFGVTRHMYCPFLRKLRQSNVPQGRYESSGLRRVTPVRRPTAVSVSPICVLKWENHRKRVSVLWISGVLWKVVG